MGPGDATGSVGERQEMSGSSGQDQAWLSKKTLVRLRKKGGWNEKGDSEETEAPTEDAAPTRRTLAGAQKG